MNRRKIGDQVEIVNMSLDDQGQMYFGTSGKIVDIRTGLFNGQEMMNYRLQFDDGYEAWISAGDCC